MGEKSGGLFNMLVVVCIAGLVIAAVSIFWPDVMTAIKDGTMKLIKSGFDSANRSVGFIGSFFGIK
ncbi:hypothetical protein NSQ59_27610 [Margalitia sp. FSL K6-0131]|uniref:hypothetical protein n=1 Tax=Margalitia sp. FSL K6-0131 TaxID=2954604 RepID=UPI0030F7A9B8